MQIVKKIGVFTLGMIAFVWFIVRVIPKPSRAAYPCQMALFPFAASFVIWATGIISSAIFFRKAKTSYSKLNFFTSALFIVLALLTAYISSVPLTQKSSEANNYQQIKTFIPTDSANSPIGIARGIFPGRVTWAYDPDAINWDGETGFWWSDNSIDTARIDNMISASLMSLTGTLTTKDSWESLFRNYNINHGKGDVGYRFSERIAIKLNMNMVGKHSQQDNSIFNSPQIVHALLRQMVYEAGIPAKNITLYDISRYIPNCIFDLCKKEFPDLIFIDNSHGKDGRVDFKLDRNVPIRWSEKIEERQASYLPNFVTKAEYIINLANLKGHSLAGVTICAKNHFGTYASYDHGNNGPMDANVHPVIAVDNNEKPYTKRPMGTYNALVDLMGHQHLGGKTLLFIVDALFNTSHQTENISSKFKLNMTPFNGNWMSSIFLSQDGVAIESVGVDFLRSEIGPVSRLVTGNVDNYLHEAALADNAPSCTFYDPEGDGSPLESLGVHEHWNNSTDKQYSRNLHVGNGIELVKVEMTTSIPSFSLNSNQPGKQLIRILNNPIKNRTLNIQRLTDNKEKIQMIISNANGEVVYSNQTQDYHVLPTAFNLNFLPSGLYILMVQQGKTKNSIRFFFVD